MENKGEIFVSSTYISPPTPSELGPYLFETHIFGHTFFDDYLQKNQPKVILLWRLWKRVELFLIHD